MKLNSPSNRRLALRHDGNSRRGFSMFDLFVAFTLLVAAMSMVAPLVVRHGQLLKSQRNYRLALDELSNQLERLRSAAARATAARGGTTCTVRLHRGAAAGGKIDGRDAPAESGSPHLAGHRLERNRPPQRAGDARRLGVSHDRPKRRTRTEGAAAMNHRRRGVSLTELLVVMTACTVVMTLTSQLICRVMRIQVESRAHVDVERNAMRLADNSAATCIRPQVL